MYQLLKQIKPDQSKTYIAPVRNFNFKQTIPENLKQIKAVSQHSSRFAFMLHSSNKLTQEESSLKERRQLLMSYNWNSNIH